MNTSDGLEWYRAEHWDSEREPAFEARLRRARPQKRPQYLRIQGFILTNSADPYDREAGRRLLRRVIDEYSEQDENWIGLLEAKTAAEMLGRSFAADDKFDDAELWLRNVISLCAVSREGRSHTTGVTELWLAEVILSRDGPAAVDEASALLSSVEPRVMAKSFLRNVVFRFMYNQARVANFSGDRLAAVSLANRALAVAAEPMSPLSRHPEVGMPRASPSSVVALKRIIDDERGSAR